MKGIGGLLVIIGLASAGLYFANMELKYLMWMSNWGEGVAWAIRGGLVAAGLILWSIGRARAKQA